MLDFVAVSYIEEDKAEFEPNFAASQSTANLYKCFR